MLWEASLTGGAWKAELCLGNSFSEPAPGALGGPSSVQSTELQRLAEELGADGRLAAPLAASES